MKFRKPKESFIILFCIYFFTHSFPVLAIDRYVNPGALSSRDEGNGDINYPYKTITFAITQLVAGDRLIISKGTYRETIDLRNAKKLTSVPNMRTSLEAAPNAKVIINGADIVTGWKSLGNNLYVKYDWPINSQQVMLDGIPLQQIGGTVFKNTEDINFIWPGRISGNVAQMTEKSFYYDEVGRSLYIKLPSAITPTGHTIEASSRNFLLFSDSLDNLTISNLSFNYANTSSQNRNGAVTLIGNNLMLNKIHIKYTDSVGLDLTGNNNVINESLFDFCGQLGIKVRGKNIKLLNNQTHYNNTRGFNKWWEAGGAKFVGNGGLQDSEISGHQAYFNNGDGIWFDWGNANNRIHNSFTAYNKGFGIHYEASQSGRIYNNYVVGNTQRGVYLPHSSGTLVTHNLIFGNEMEGSVVIDEGRRSSTLDLIPNNNLIIGNINAWNKNKELILPDNILNNRSNSNLYLTFPDQPSFSLGWFTKIAAGLAEWRGITYQDGRSWQKVMSVPTIVASSLALKSIAIGDWSPLLDIGKNYMVDYPYNQIYQNYPDIQIGGKPVGPILN